MSNNMVVNIDGRQVTLFSKGNNGKSYIFKGEETVQTVKGVKKLFISVYEPMSAEVKNVAPRDEQLRVEKEAEAFDTSVQKVERKRRSTKTADGGMSGTPEQNKMKADLLKLAASMGLVLTPG